MFDIAPTELIVLGAVAILVIPPKDLPKALRIAGHWMGRARSVARQFRSGFDEMLREAELAEMEKKWREENARIMAEHPPTPTVLEGPGGIVSSEAVSKARSGQKGADDDAADPSHLDAGLRDNTDRSDDSNTPPAMVEKPAVKPAAAAEPDLFADHLPGPPARDPANS